MLFKASELRTRKLKDVYVTLALNMLNIHGHNSSMSMTSLYCLYTGGPYVQAQPGVANILHMYYDKHKLSNILLVKKQLFSNVAVGKDYIRTCLERPPH